MPFCAVFADSDAVPPGTSWSGCRPAYRHHRSHTWLFCACVASRRLYNACSNYPPPSFHQSESVVRTTQRDSTTSVLFLPYILSRLRGFSPFLFLALATTSRRCLSFFLLPSRSINHLAPSSSRLFLLEQLLLRLPLHCRNASWEMRYQQGYQNGGLVSFATY